MKKLSREEMKFTKGSGCTYVCCWEGTNNCSSSVTVEAGVSASCVKGAQLRLLESN